MQLDGLGAVISASTIVNIVNADGTAYVPPTVIMPDQITSTTILLAIIFSSVVGAIGLAIGLFFLIRKLKMKSRNQVHDLSEKEMDVSNVQKDKDLIIVE